MGNFTTLAQSSTQVIPGGWQRHANFVAFTICIDQGVAPDLDDDGGDDEETNKNDSYTYIVLCH